ncbi:sn-glycerol-1-phosphate dehydrogenase [Maledivibacter halophilus]|uniref:Glycerol-1-phosphate dehydrogenase [NAD(P)+] n=1 Tax=Maledivibacter halophilus TaxID=36842 RepID=A0A1T5M5A0_9FIRM|nr:sn-glycerol-1-phosphate dehydrogenase [Maledivibacter halophilus]SKC83406.1 glycerol-1-phosphate dehydrogenase [NAD(P)+] [Maledivibacter halophilus]
MSDFTEIINKDILCKCGNKHYIPIEYIDLKYNIKGISEICKRFFKGNDILIVSDIHTYEIQGEKIIGYLKKEFKIQSVVFDDEKLVPDEKAIGTILMNRGFKIDGMIAVGSGTINDLVRFISSRLGVPFISLPTAPSMDGYASAVSSLILKNEKITFPGVPPEAILGNIDIIKNAPLDMIQSGFGDIIGKKISLSDWILSVKLKGEYFCEYAANLVESATSICIENANNIYNREEKGINELLKALILSGLAISIVGDSRPASGTEHLLAHYFEVDFMKKGRKPIYHGTAVAIGTLIGSIVYNYILESKEFKNSRNSRELKKSLEKYVPDTLEVEKWLRAIGLSKSPIDYGIEKDLLKEALLKARFTRKRYTILSYGAEIDVLKNASEYIIEKLY